MKNFQPLEVVDRGSETQLQVVEIKCTDIQLYNRERPEFRFGVNTLLE